MMFRNMGNTSTWRVGTLLAITAIAFLLPSTGSAQGKKKAVGPPPLIDMDAEYTVGKGDMIFDFELSGGVFAGDTPTGDDEGAVDFRLGANYFVTDWLAPGLHAFANDLGAVDIVRGGLLFDARVYYPTGERYLPYGMLGLGFQGIDAGPYEETFFDFMLGFGVDFLMTPNVALGIGFRYDLLANSDFTTHEIRFPIKFTLYFDGPKF